jgi:hypothetical protein
MGKRGADAPYTHLLPLFSTFQHYIRGFHQRQRAGKIILVLQGLRAYFVAESGRIVAPICNC